MALAVCKEAHWTMSISSHRSKENSRALNIKRCFENFMTPQCTGHKSYISITGCILVILHMSEEF